MRLTTSILLIGSAQAQLQPWRTGMANVVDTVFVASLVLILGASGFLLGQGGEFFSLSLIDGYLHYR